MNEETLKLGEKIMKDIRDDQRRKQHLMAIDNLLCDAMALLTAHEQHDEPSWKDQYEDVCKRYTDILEGLEDE